jgi:hypothetical protein
MTIYYEGDYHPKSFNYCVLPKWPEMVVVGNPVTQKQAAEIILRIDHNIPTPWSNDKRHATRIKQLFGIPSNAVTPYNQWEGISNLSTDLNGIALEYLSTDRVISSYIDGSNGWINWDGMVRLSDKNIGKHPDTTTVAEEWHTIATAFPYLDLRCQLFDGESCEYNTKPVVHFIVKNGDVTVRPSNGAVLMEPEPVNIAKLTRGPQGRLDRGVGISIEDLKTKLEMVYGTIPQYREPH